MTEQLANAVKGLVPGFSDSEMEALYKIAKPITMCAGDYFIQADHVPRKFGFVLTGVLRYLYSDLKGRQFTKGFFCENSFVSAYTAMKNQTPSAFSIEALSPIEILEIDFFKWLKLKEANEKWNLFLIALLEKGYATKEKRERELLLLDAESRYRIFLDTFSHIELRVKQHMIASYLGITPIALSRIRKNIRA